MPNANITFRNLPSTAIFQVAADLSSGRYNNYIEFDEPISSFAVSVTNKAIMLINHENPKTLSTLDFTTIKHKNNISTNAVTFTDNALILLSELDSVRTFDFANEKINNLCFISVSTDSNIYLQIYK